MQNLTNKEAHLLFNQLYSRARSPAEQERVEKIVSSTHDIYERIQLIENLEKKTKKPGGTPARSSPRTSTPAPKSVKKEQKVTTRPHSEGWFTRLWNLLLGNDLTRWGMDTGTISPGLFFSEPGISKGVKKLFDTLDVANLTAAMGVFNLILGNAWKKLPADRYNVLMSTYLFLNELVKNERLIHRGKDAAAWITTSTKMQKFYAELIRYPNFQEVLRVDFPDLAAETPPGETARKTAKSVAAFIFELERGTPSLHDAILAFYVLDRNTLCSWESICEELQSREPELKTYRAPTGVRTRMRAHAEKLHEQYRKNLSRIKELKHLNQNELKLNFDGDLDTTFLLPILEDVLKRVYSPQEQTSHKPEEYRQDPLRLLWALHQDLSRNLISMFAGSVAVDTDEDTQIEVILFNLGLFKPLILKFNQVVSNTDLFLKKNRLLDYNFEDYIKEANQPPDNPVRAEFHALTTESLTIFKSLVKALKVVLLNHKNAAKRASSPELEGTKKIPIERLDILARFLPFADSRLAGANRLSGNKVQEALQTELRQLYNYLFLFHDPSFMKAMNSLEGMNEENQNIKEELDRLGFLKSSEAVA